MKFVGIGYSSNRSVIESLKGKMIREMGDCLGKWGDFGFVGKWGDIGFVGKWGNFWYMGKWGDFGCVGKWDDFGCVVEWGDFGFVVVEVILDVLCVESLVVVSLCRRRREVWD